MNSQILDILQKEYGCGVTTDFYKHIDLWRDWWKGYHKPFHHFKFDNGEKMLERDMFTLKMAKKVCEDWASVLLNQKTKLILKDTASGVWLQGENETGGVLGNNNFWLQGNLLMEKAFYSGTAAAVIRFKHLRMMSDGQVLRTPETSVKISYISAEHIVVLSTDSGAVTEVAFCSEHIDDGNKYIYLEIHTLNKDGTYVIKNRYFKSENGMLSQSPLPAGMAETVRTGSPVPLFAVISPAIVNNIDESSGMGISVFADAIDQLKGIDIAYNNFVSDFKLGAKKVFMNSSLIKQASDGTKVAPDDTNQQLFCYVGDELMNNSDGSKQLIQEHNPTIRVEENTKGIQAGLDYLSFKVGFGTKHYQFNAGSIVTATQYTGDKQDMIQNANKHYTAVEAFLQQLVRGLLWAGKNVLGANVDQDTEITINFDRSALIDENAERLKDKDEVRDELMLPWEYRVKWYGETKEQAKAILAQLESDDDLMGFDGGED